MKITLNILIIITILFTSFWSAEAYRKASYHSYITWPKGWCYYINSHWNKTYVARNKCKK